MAEPLIKTGQRARHLLDAAHEYFDLGWEPLVLPYKEKSPRGKWKEQISWTPEKIETAFGENCNIGIALGPRSNDLVDIDFDCLEAAKLAEVILPELPSFGRASSPQSHRVVRAVLKKGRLTFQLPTGVAEQAGTQRAMILEVRGKGHQTMFPPSVHPSGEVVAWASEAASVPQIDGKELARRCGLLAALSVIAMFYPKAAGERDEIAMMLSGVLVRCGLSDDEVNSLTAKVAEVGGDDEANKRGHKSQASRAKIDAGEPVWGLPELCRRLNIESLLPKLREWLGLIGGTAATDNRTRILVRPGHTPEEVDQAESALLKTDLPIFQRGECLVRVTRLPVSTATDGVRRPRGMPILLEVSKPWLKEKFALAAIWLKPGEEGNVVINPPGSHVSALLDRLGEWNAPVLNGVISSPTLRPDGTLLQEPGYDQKTGLLYDTNDLQFPIMPEKPTKQEARDALIELSRPFRDFKFSEDADRSVLLCALLTTLVRRNLPSAPLFAIDAPTAGSGKSLLAETVGIIGMGYKPSMMSQGKSAEEDEKRLSSVLLSGDAMLVIDNCDRVLQGDTICTMLTQEFISIRPLGKSEVRKLPTNIVVMATGNNLEIAGDLGRRSLICRIDTGEERPDQIDFDFDPRREALADRPSLVVAGLTVLRAYDTAGRPTDLTPMGSFEDWNFIREALVWLGAADPILTRERVMADDPRKGELAELMDIWWVAVKDRAVTLAEIEEEGQRTDLNPSRLLYDALAARTHKGHFNSRSVGRYLSKQKDRVVGGRVLRAVDDPSGVKRYRLETVNKTMDDIPF